MSARSHIEFLQRLRGEGKERKEKERKGRERKGKERCKMAKPVVLGINFRQQ